jgi:hypothetical protein
LSIRYPPETELDFSASYSGKNGTVKWQKADDGQTDGRLNFAKMFTPHTWAVAYALVEVTSSEDRNVHLRIGSDDGVKIWLNDRIIWTNRTDRSIQIDQDVVPDELRKGRNRLLFKVDQGIGSWGMIFRITDLTGRPIQSLHYQRASMNES